MTAAAVVAVAGSGSTEPASNLAGAAASAAATALVGCHSDLVQNTVDANFAVATATATTGGR